MLNIVALSLVFVGSALASAGLIWLLQPLWLRYALAKPNSRSSHKMPTPQGGGIVVIAVTVAIVSLATTFIPGLAADTWRLAVVFSGTVALAVVGAVDDLHVLEAVPRLLLQTAAVALVIAALPPDLRIINALPWWVERGIILVGGVWFVNLVNFMDGIDWMTVAEVVPVTAGIGLLGLMGALPQDATMVALAVCGAMIGFAPFNRPVARLFLGDVGSLPIGLLLCWLLTLLAASGHLTAALLLPLYYLADATVTLLLRLIKGKPLMQAHRDHFYQHAFDNGRAGYDIVGQVFILNVALGGLAAVTTMTSSNAIKLAMLALGSALVTGLLWYFRRGQR
jgi:UDP-N-acetylmuramyl pentapeptide phosphotransferase/UDP-N-acetylglucosamine-1-phosphate transferase